MNASAIRIIIDMSDITLRVKIFSKLHQFLVEYLLF